jgi:hypothetical protein
LVKKKVAKVEADLASAQIAIQEEAVITVLAEKMKALAREKKDRLQKTIILAAAEPAAESLACAKINPQRAVIFLAEAELENPSQAGAAKKHSKLKKIEAMRCGSS